MPLGRLQPLPQVFSATIQTVSIAFITPIRLLASLASSKLILAVPTMVVVAIEDKVTQRLYRIKVFVFVLALVVVEIFIIGASKVSS